MNQFINQLWEMAQASGLSAGGVTKESATLQGIMAFGEIYIGNPLGMYELKAAFQADRAVPRGRALAAPLSKF